MTGLALRGLLSRKLRTALTAVAIVLGVAMIAGTYVQTDQIRTAFDDIEQAANAGVDVRIAPKTAFSGNFAADEPISEALLGQLYLVTVVALLVSRVRPAGRDGGDSSSAS